MSLRRLFQLHGWLGLNLGFLLFVVCLSGTVATLGDEIDWVIHPEMRVEPGEGTASWAEIVENVRDRYPGERIVALQQPPGPRFAARVLVWLPAGRGSELAGRLVHVDPHTGRITGETNPFLSVQHLFRLFHKQLFIYGSPVPHGTILVGVLGLFLCFSVLSGFLIYRSWLSNLFTLRTGRPRRFWSDAHRLLGIWGLAFSLLIGLTGTWYLADRLLENADLAGQDMVVQRVDPSRAGPVLEPPDLDAALDSVRGALGDVEVTGARLPVAPGGTAVFYAAAGPLADDASHVAVLAPESGEVLSTRQPGDLSFGERLNHAVTPLHFGDFGGLATRGLWFLLGIGLCVSILAGARIWYLRTRRLSGSGPGPAWLRGAALVVTLCVVATAAYHTVWHVRDRLPPPAAPVLASGTASLGPWRAEVWLEDAGEDVTAVARLLGEDGGHANVRAARVCAGPVGDVDASRCAPVRPLYSGQRVVLADAPGQIGRPLWITATSWTDSRWTGQVRTAGRNPGGRTAMEDAPTVASDAVRARAPAFGRGYRDLGIRTGVVIVGAGFLLVLFLVGAITTWCLGRDVLESAASR